MINIDNKLFFKKTSNIDICVCKYYGCFSSNKSNKVYKQKKFEIIDDINNELVNYLKEFISVAAYINKSEVDIVYDYDINILRSKLVKIVYSNKDIEKLYIDIYSDKIVFSIVCKNNITIYDEVINTNYINIIKNNTIDDSNAHYLFDLDKELVTFLKANPEANIEEIMWFFRIGKITAKAAIRRLIDSKIITSFSNKVINVDSI